ncbi:hypothetical protein LX86_003050 [Lentzea aerocolonigenes]|nr:hypothetical protein [Lentzea aerocolonigenes]
MDSLPVIVAGAGPVRSGRAPAGTRSGTTRAGGWLPEIRLDLDPVLQVPVKLAPLIDPNAHSRGTVYPHGESELRQPEQGVYLVGMKSYGRALTGYEQVRSVVAAIAGDHEAAGRVELVLPETGVCGGAGSFAG